MEEKLVLVEANRDLITVKQLPIIEDRLEEVYLSVKDRLEAMSNLVVTEENYKELKKTRADLNKEFGELEALRKHVKSAIEAPYKKFETGAYKRVSDLYRDAIGKLDGEVKDFDGGLKTQKQNELLAYFDEYRQSLGLDSAIADFKRSGIKVGLSGSMKSLKEQVRQYLDRVDGDLKMIETLENRDEVLAEYRVLLNVSDAVLVVAERKKRIEAERQRREEEAAARERVEAQVAAVEAAVEAVGPPVAQEVAEETESAEEPIYSTVFRVHGTLEMLRNLKAFLRDGGYEFENVEV